jgi:hypothetical protein
MNFLIEFLFTCILGGDPDAGSTNTPGSGGTGN